MRMKAAACQIPADVARPVASHAEAAVREAVATGARLVVLPEQALSGCRFADADEARAAAETLDGPTVSLFRSLSAELDCVLVAGFTEQGAGSQIHNSAVLVDRGEVVDTYRKVHLWGEEARWFTPGDRAPRAVETSVGRVASLICYDLEIPEWVRLAALDGADVIAAPCNWPLLPRPRGERPLEVIRAQASAGTNKVYVVAADRCGIERGQEWIGGSCIVDASGYLLAGPATAEGDPATAVVLTADLDLTVPRDKRLDTFNDAFADRRPDLYGGLTTTYDAPLDTTHATPAGAPVGRE